MNAARGDPGGPEEAPIGAQEAARARILVNAFHCHPTAGLQTKDKLCYLPTLVLNPSFADYPAPHREWPLVKSACGDLSNIQHDAASFS